MSSRLATWSAVLALGLAAACAGDDDDVQSDGSPSTGGSLGSDTGGTKGKGDAGEGGEQNAGPQGDTGGEAGNGAVSGGSGMAGDGGGGESASARGGTAGASASGGTAGTSANPMGERYASVVAVATSGDDGAYTFSVSVESTDIDCTQFANWWEVLGEDGTLLYRRILEHSHTDENGTTDSGAPGNTFTRSGGPVPVGSGDVVLVRAHLSTGGYDGMVMRGSVRDGFTNALDIGADFAAEVENASPQPTGCAF